MKKDTVVSLKKPAEESDPLSSLLREGARALLHDAVEAELATYLSEHAGECDAAGRRCIVRNGYLPERTLLTGLGEVPIRVPKTRDRGGRGRHFTSGLLPPYIKRTASVESVLPWLYLKGVSTGDMSAALAALLGEQAQGLSAATVSRLKRVWEDEYQSWRRRDFKRQRYVYVWVDGIYFNVRGEDARQCLLVMIGVDEWGRKALLAVEDGYRESKQSWRELLVDLQSRGFTPPSLAVGDGALGFWAALAEVSPTTRTQRCWVHKMANVLNKLPKGVQAKAKQGLQAIWMAESRAAALKAFDRFIRTYEDKYPKATAPLEADRDSLLAFYDFPAAHWQSIRTTNPIESTFATVRLRTARTRGCVSRTSLLTMVYKLGLCAEQNWRRLRGFKHLADVIENVKFIDGVKEETLQQHQRAA
ncbi:MAG: IS256 family transposase [Gammaproteobacteria bacterium]|nr:IS256 family transposase [Gammaproteobacteria bacterium]